MKLLILWQKNIWVLIKKIVQKSCSAPLRTNNEKIRLFISKFNVKLNDFFDLIYTAATHSKIDIIMNPFEE